MPRIAPESTADAPAEGEPWTPPLWILSTDPRHAARVAALGSRSQVNPMFRLKAAQIEAKAYQAIKSRIAGTTPREQEPAFRKKYQLKIQGKQRKVADHEAALEELLEKKNESLDDIQNVRRQEMEKEIKAMETKLRKEHQAKVKERKKQWESQIEAEFEDRRKRLKRDQESRRVEREEARANAKATEEEELPKINEDTERMKRELADIKAEIEQLNDRKSEMIWLLKQVIKAEEKQKAQALGEKRS